MTSWQDIDLDARPERRSDVAEVVVDDETVIHEVDSGRSHVLNQTAGTIWTVLDGTVSISELADEVAEAFGIDLDVMQAQLTDLVRDLGRLGLLVGVAGHGQEEPACP